jgi:hypothetical protein
LKGFIDVEAISQAATITSNSSFLGVSGENSRALNTAQSRRYNKKQSGCANQKETS